MLGLLCCFSIAACSRPGPLKFNKAHAQHAPWCGPNQRVQIGQRVVGHVHDGPKHKEFLVDAGGREHDPEKIAEQAWAYLERTGDAKTIAGAFIKDARQTTMSVVSVNPVVVILGSYQDESWLKQPRDSADKSWFWRAQIQPTSDPPYRDGLKWFSPTLKQPPIALAFSHEGVAEIVLPAGKLTLTRVGDRCQSTRE